MAQYIKPIIPFVGNKSLYYKYINEILDNAIILSNYLLYMFHKADTIDELKNSPCYYNRLIKNNLRYIPIYEYNNIMTQRRNARSGGTYDYIIYNIQNE